MHGRWWTVSDNTRWLHALVQAQDALNGRPGLVLKPSGHVGIDVLVDARQGVTGGGAAALQLFEST